MAGTGLNLCVASSFGSNAKVGAMFNNELPKIHYQFGPIYLREALQMLAGPAYELTIDDINRIVCFKPRVVPAKDISPVEKVISTTTIEVIEE